LIDVDDSFEFIDIRLSLSKPVYKIEEASFINVAIAFIAGFLAPIAAAPKRSEGIADSGTDAE
jgi:hypothetical protein